VSKRLAVIPFLAVALMSCDAAAGNESAGNEAARADTETQRPLPCAVVAHGMGMMTDALRGTPPRGDCDDSVDPRTVPLDELVSIIPDQHPAFYYILATRLFAADRRDEAVFWFYAGQLRYRVRLACHPDLAPDTEPALFASLHQSVGETINEYAGGDPDAWIAAMRRALEWDERTHNGFEPKIPCARQIAEQREGMGQLIRQVDQNRDRLRAERAARGLSNR